MGGTVHTRVYRGSIWKGEELVEDDAAGIRI